MTQDEIQTFERMIDDQQDPVSRGVSMMLLRLIQELQAKIVD